MVFHDRGLQVGCCPGGHPCSLLCLAEEFPVPQLDTHECRDIGSVSTLAAMSHEPCLWGFVRVSWALWQISNSEVCLSRWALRDRNDSSPLLLAYLPFSIRWLLNPIFRSSSKGMELWQAAEGAPGCFLRSEVFCLPKVRGFHLSVYIRMSQPVDAAVLHHPETSP